MKSAFNKQIWNATKGNKRFRVGSHIYEPIFRLFGLVIYREVESFVSLYKAEAGN